MTTPKPLVPDRQDFAAIEREYGLPPANASDEQLMEHYRLAQAAKLIRLYENGKLPLPVMRELDKAKYRRR
jgi:hypothetical protein